MEAGGGGTTILSLPQPLLETVFEFLPAAEVSRCGRVSRLFRTAAAVALRSRLWRLFRRIEREMTALERRTEEWAAQSGPRPWPVAALLGAKRRHSVLRLLMSVVRVLRAACWRYMRMDEPMLCLPAGGLLDEAGSLLEAASTQDWSRLPYLDPGDAARLLLRAHDFLDEFDSCVEPALPQRTPFGVKLVDLLDCCQTSSYEVSLTKHPGQPLFFLHGIYQMRCVRDSPPVVCHSTAPAELKLLALGRYVRGCAGWGDMLSTVRELWDLEDAAEVAAAAAAALRPPGVPPSYSRAHLRRQPQLHQQHQQQQRRGSGPATHRLVFSRDCGRAVSDGAVLWCEVQLQGDARHHLPLDLEFLGTDIPSPPNSRLCLRRTPSPPPEMTLLGWILDPRPPSASDTQAVLQSTRDVANPPHPEELLRNERRAIVDGVLEDLIRTIDRGNTWPPEEVELSEVNSRSSAEEGEVGAAETSDTQRQPSYSSGISPEVTLTAQEIIEELLKNIDRDYTWETVTASSVKEDQERESARSQPPRNSANGAFKSTTTSTAEPAWDYSFSMSMSMERPLYDGGAPHQQVLVIMTHSASNTHVTSFADINL